jgi:hypothetical protein
LPDIFTYKSTLGGNGDVVSPSDVVDPVMNFWMEDILHDLHVG